MCILLMLCPEDGTASVIERHSTTGRFYARTILRGNSACWKMSPATGFLTAAETEDKLVSWHLCPELFLSHENEAPGAFLMGHRAGRGSSHDINLNEKLRLKIRLKCERQRQGQENL